METQSFTALELYCLAYLCGKTRMYGLPDVMSAIPDEEREKAIEATVSSFLDRGILSMDFDGNQSLQPQYIDLVSAYCDCQKCLTVELSEAELSRSVIVWKNKDSYLLAQSAGNCSYAISDASEDSVRETLGSISLPSQGNMIGTAATLPNCILSKAGRLINQGDTEGASRLLRQNGAGEDVAEILLDGIQKKAVYVSCLLIDLNDPGKNTENFSALCSRGAILRLSRTYSNLRSCTLFECISAGSMHKDLIGLADSFFAETEAKNE